MASSSVDPVRVSKLPALMPRPADSHKGSFGRVLVVAGSLGMSGAAILCGSGALRGGAGLVRVAVPREILPMVAAGNPCYTTVPLPQDTQGQLTADADTPLLELIADNDVLAMGPGLSQSPGVRSLVAAVLTRTQIPLVLDADGLNVLSPCLGFLQGRSATVLTPHPGEFARLLGCSIGLVQKQRQELAIAFAVKHQVVVVLKGRATIVTDGHRLYVNTTGNPGMATGGSGDVLSGVIAALMGQGLEPWVAAQVGVYIHGLAGDLARNELGEVALIASDLLNFLPKAFCQYQSQSVS
jgi:NAD(P)H-hydrate epimerase